jgi:ADP-ribosyl-[dinitrogen reductase] hydrolase
MALAIAYSLIEKGGVDPKDIKDKFLDWHLRGDFDSRGKPSHGSGENTRKALDAYHQDRSKVFADPSKNAGNGCIMRLAPVPIFYHNNLDQAMQAAALQAKTTHHSNTAMEASALLAYIVHRALNYDPTQDPSASKESLHRRRKKYALRLQNYLQRRSQVLPELDQKVGKAQKHVQSLTTQANETWRKLSREDFIKKLTDYAKANNDKQFAARSARDTLAVALWCVQHTNSFEKALEEAVNMGGDSDTIGAVTGQIAGAIYGYDAIPKKWKVQLRTNRYNIADIAATLYRSAP